MKFVKSKTSDICAPRAGLNGLSTSCYWHSYCTVLRRYANRQAYMRKEMRYVRARSELEPELTTLCRWTQSLRARDGGLHRLPHLHGDWGCAARVSMPLPRLCRVRPLLVLATVVRVTAGGGGRFDLLGVQVPLRRANRGRSRAYWPQEGRGGATSGRALACGGAA